MSTDTKCPEELRQAYNYDTFVSENYQRWFQFHKAPAPGDRVDDFPLLTLEGDRESLKSLIRHNHLTILEFGSFT